MLKNMRKQLKNEKGLTLIELLAVIVILGIVAAIAVPAIGGIIENSRAKALVSDTVNVMNAANIYFTDKQPGAAATDKTVDLDGLKNGKFLESEGKLTEATVTFVSDGQNTITAKGTNGSVKLDITGKTLQDLIDDEISVVADVVTFTTTNP